MNNWDDIFDEDSKEDKNVEDNRTAAKKFFDENKYELLGAALGTVAALLYCNRKSKRRNTLKQNQDRANREMLIYTTGYTEGQRDAYRDVANNRHRSHNHKKNHN